MWGSLGSLFGLVIGEKVGRISGGNFVCNMVVNGSSLALGA